MIKRKSHNAELIHDENKDKLSAFDKLQEIKFDDLNDSKLI